MTSQFQTPAAMRRALTDRLRILAASGRWTLPQLQRLIAYDRLLERLYRRSDGWIVKGAAALLAREIGVRATIDLDVYRAGEVGRSESDLREATLIDLEDWFVFEIGSPRAAGDVGVGRRLPVTATIGGAIWSSFHVDLVSGLTMIGKPDRVAALAPLGLPSVKQGGYLAYPLIDHIADKVAAMYELHGSAAMPSTRYRDLVDLVAIALVASPTADPLRKAIRSEESRRGIRLPGHLVVPDRSLWTGGYAAEARRSLLTEGRSLAAAIEVAGSLLNPILDGTGRGKWDPSLRRWRPG